MSLNLINMENHYTSQKVMTQKNGIEHTHPPMGIFLGNRNHFKN